MSRRRDANTTLQSNLSKPGGGLTTGGAGGVAGDVYLGSETKKMTVPTGRAGRKQMTVTTDITESLADAIARAYTWTEAQRKAFIAKARALGYTDVNDVTSPNLWAMAVNGAAEWYKNSNRSVKMTPEMYLEWYAKGKGLGTAEKPSVSKTITQYGAPQIRDWINDGLKRKFTRGLESLDDQEREILFNAVREYLDKAAVTTVTKGPKGESITTVKPGPSTAGVQEVVEKTAMGLPGFAEDADRTKKIEFSQWLTQNAPGA